ncbi:MAG: HlyD family efflux transporter periplasmic adaptor subunit [Massilia sp.]
MKAQARLLLPLLGAALLLSGCGPNTGAAQAKPAPAPAAPLKRPLLITGLVDAIDSQDIPVPPSDSSPVVLRNFVAEGATVKAGDVVLRIEAQERASVEQLRVEAEQARARADKDIADLEAKTIDAERALATARAALAKAKVDAALPRTQISGLDFDRYQGERDRAALDLEVKKKAAAIATDAITRRRADAKFEAMKKEASIAFTIARQELVKVRAKRDGVMVHGYSEWRGERYDEGSSAYPGNTVGQVMGDGRMRVRAWALEADRPFITQGQQVRVSFDALPGVFTTAAISAIASAPEARAIWGKSRYFRLDVALPDDHRLPLTAGMSALIEPLAASPAPAAAAASSVAPSAPADLQLEGEIASRLGFPIAPPNIRYVWQYNLVQLAPEGASVKAGQPIATFQANEVRMRLEELRSGLREKQSTLAKLRLEHAEAERSAALTVAETASNQERAQRKASQPKELIRRIDYDKLVIDRGLAEELATLALRQRDAQARARHAEVSNLGSEIAQYEQEIALLVKGTEAMTVKAPHDGILLYRTQFNGEKIAVGAQVWTGMSVATLADPAQLVVMAKVPEAQAAGVLVGRTARVTVPGAASVSTARVVRLGRVYHGKSSSQPVVVRDIELAFDGMAAGAKPGAAVQVTLLAPKGTP